MPPSPTSSLRVAPPDMAVTFDGGEDEPLAPVIPLFDARGAVAEKNPLPPPRARTTVGIGRGLPSHSAPSAADDEGGHEVADVAAAAESTLLRRLRTRQLSVSEARAVVTEAGLDSGAAEAMLEDFARLGYLDDAGLADQLVYAAVTRKGQGRQVIAPLLTKRGIPRDVADAALGALPDDEAERALDFARTKARSLGARDRETSMRRLTGQLARRGYPSSISLAAARQALDEL
ncbi:regulatory protein RecX [Microbacterium sp. P05]|uniref:regulatory protein RecX n=1 Tax=Microbacterium sp. P05 TaxID=3366948 RepID=UPI003744E287